jgi:hypothetical protein
MLWLTGKVARMEEEMNAYGTMKRKPEKLPL